MIKSERFIILNKNYTFKKMMSIPALQKEVLAEAPTESTMTDGVRSSTLLLITLLYRPPSWPSSTMEASSWAPMPALPT
jgi:hypothetical protein